MSFAFLDLPNLSLNRNLQSWARLHLWAINCWASYPIDKYSMSCCCMKTWQYRLPCVIQNVCGNDLVLVTSSTSKTWYLLAWIKYSCLWSLVPSLSQGIPALNWGWFCVKRHLSAVGPSVSALILSVLLSCSYLNYVGMAQFLQIFHFSYCCQVQSIFELTHLDLFDGHFSSSLYRGT